MRRTRRAVPPRARARAALVRSLLHELGAQLFDTALQYFRAELKYFKAETARALFKKSQFLAHMEEMEEAVDATGIKSAVAIALFQTVDTELSLCLKQRCSDGVPGFQAGYGPVLGA